jgi:hypothetical protein
MRHVTSFAALVASAALWAFACSGAATDAPASSSADAATDSAPTTAPPDAAPTSDASGDAEDAGERAVTSTAECFIYCERLERLCVGDMRQFSSLNTCLRACNLYPEGQPDDATGNSRYCRALHARAAESYVDQRRGHCLHAGPYGYGGCGEPCESLCVLSVAWCGTGVGAPYASEAECLAACNTFQPAYPEPIPGIPQYNAAGPLTGDSVDCRQVHMMLALESPTARDQRCPAVAVASTACK